MQSFNKVTVGIFVVGGLLLFGVGLFMIGDRRQLFSESMELHAEFRDLSGLKPGANVRVSGMDAGEVLSIHIPPRPEDRFQVRFRVTENFGPVLRKDSVASIQTEGVVGSTFLQVDFGSAQAAVVEDGDTIESREPFNFAELMQNTNTAVTSLNLAVDEVKGDVEAAFQSMATTSTSANELLARLSKDMEGFTESSDQIVDDIEALVAGIRQGRGTVGRLFQDEEIYRQMASTVQQAEQTLGNWRKTSEQLNRMVAELRSREVAENLAQTASNIREFTQGAKDAVSGFGGEETDEPRSLAAGLHEVIDSANEALTDLSDNAEALKRNWFLRGFFKKRGFFDLDNIPVEEYRAGKFAPKRIRRRTWVDKVVLFERNSDGSEVLSAKGKQTLDESIGEFLPYARSHPIMIEGYASEGSPEQQYLRSLERGSRVRKYLVEKFELQPSYVGVMPMGAVRSASPDGLYWEGVSLVFFFTKDVIAAVTGEASPEAAPIKSSLVQER